MAGVTDQGFVVKTTEEIDQEIKDCLRADISASLNLTPESALGQIVSIFAAKTADVWETMRAVYMSNNPKEASGRALDQIGSFAGITRNAATPSTVTAELTLDPGATVPIGSVAAVAGLNGAQFETLAPVTNGGGVPAVFPVLMQSLETGPIQALSGTLTVIVTPVTGWTAVNNPLDAMMGSFEETDEEFRARYEAAVKGQGCRTIPSIIARVLQVADVNNVLISENTLDVPVGVLPGHSIMVVVDDGGLGVPDDIAQAIWDSKAEGIETVGTFSGNATDDAGGVHVVRFERVTVTPVYVDIDIDAGACTPELLAAVATNVAEWGDANVGIGQDLILSQLCTPIFGTSPDISDIIEVRAGLAPSPVGTANLVASPFERLDLDTSRITVNCV